MYMHMHIYLSSPCVSVCLYCIGPDKHALVLHKLSARISAPDTPLLSYNMYMYMHMHIYLSSPCVCVCLYCIGPDKHALLLYKLSARISAPDTLLLS